MKDPYEERHRALRQPWAPRPLVRRPVGSGSVIPAHTDPVCGGATLQWWARLTPRSSSGLRGRGLPRQRSGPRMIVESARAQQPPEQTPCPRPVAEGSPRPPVVLGTPRLRVIVGSPQGALRGRRRWCGGTAPGVELPRPFGKPLSMLRGEPPLPFGKPLSMPRAELPLPSLDEL